jgi:hypothetical protein
VSDAQPIASSVDKGATLGPGGLQVVVTQGIPVCRNRVFVASLVYLEPDLTCPHPATDPLARFQHRDAHTFSGEPPRRREACDAGAHHHDMLAVRIVSAAPKSRAASR